MLFYILSILVIGLVIPNNDPNLLNANSNDIALAPFTLVFKRAGFQLASHIMNGVVLSSALSAGMYLFLFI